MKKCCTCKIEKEFDNFNKNRKNKDGYNKQCRECASMSNAAYYYKTHNFQLQRGRDKHKRKSKCRRRETIMRMYKLNIDDFNKMLFEQKEKCAICDIKPTDTLCIDHNHITGKIRGLLCRKCNMAMGILKLDQGLELLFNSIKYFKEKN